MRKPIHATLTGAPNHQAIARAKLAQAEALIGDAARALARWSAEAPTIMHDPWSSMMNTTAPPTSLEHRGKMAEEVGRLGAKVGDWAKTLGEAGA